VSIFIVKVGASPASLNEVIDMRSVMNEPSAITLTTLALLFLLPSGAIGQQRSLKEQLVGTWTYVSVDTVRPNGSRVPMFGPNPTGIAIFDHNGHYLLLTARYGLPQFEANNRMEGTAEENKAVVQGSIAHFGRYTVNESDKTITFHIQPSTFPNWNGTKQSRAITLSGDELRWTTAASSGGTAEVILQRAK
jgi:hypothetical protein